MKIFTEKPRVFLLLVLVIIAISVVNGKHAQQKNVQVSLRAKWPGTSILLEAGELLADERKDYFWEFITKWLESNSQHLTSSKECFQEILKHGNSFLSNHLASFYQLSLISRLASPRVVVYRQLAQESLLSKQYEKIDDKGKRNATDMHSSSKGDKDRWSINRNPDSPKGNCCWVDVGSTVLFAVPELSSWIDNSKTMSQDSREPETFMFDHVYPESNRRSNKAILYAAPGTKCFSKFHSALVDASNKGKVQYVLRPVLPNGCELEADYCATVGTGKTINLGGYGVELALKNMEYKAMDDSVVKKGVVLEDPRTEDLSQEVRGFIFSKLLERKPELTLDLMTFRDSLLSSTVSDTLDVWELKDLGHQTVQRIIQASDPFHTMQEINQNFPFVVSSLSRMKLSEHVKDEIISNQRMIPPGKCLMAINGALINAESIDLFSMMELIHEELSLAGQLSKFNIPHKDIKSLLYTTESSEQSSIRLDFRTSDVHYLNNLEEDPMYRRWRSNLNELLMPIFPGQFHYIRKNLYHAVYVIDPSSLKGLKVVDTIMYLHDNNVPMRFGIILFSSKVARNIEENDGEIPDSFTLKNAKPQKQQDDTASTIISLFYYIKEKYDVKMAFKFLYELNTLCEATKADEEDLIELSFIEDAFIETVRGKADSTPQEILLKLENDLSFIEKAYESTHSVCKLGLTQLNPTLLMNGLVYGNVQAQEAALQAMSEELPRIQEKVYYRQIDSHSDILETFLSEQSHLRHNPKIVQEEKDHQSFVSLTAFVLRNDSIFSKLQFLHSPKTEDDVKPVTHLIVVDLTSKEGLKLLLQGVRYLLHGSEKSRIGILYNSDIDVPNFEKLPTMFLINTIQISLSFKQRHKTLDFLKQLITWYEKEYLTDSNKIEINVESFIEAVSKLAEANDLKHDIMKSALSNLSLDSTKIFLQKVITFLSSEIGLMPGDNAVVTNGRVLLQNGQRFLVDDFKLLEAVEYEKRIKSISSVIEQVEWTGIDPDELTSDFLSNAVMAISSATNVRSRSSEKARFEMLNAEHSAVVQESENSFIHIDAVIDPLSSLGQKLAPLLRLAVEWFQPSARIILNPVTSLADLPLKNFYRYVVPSEKELTSDSSSEGPIAWFSNMPLSKTLTMNLDVPEPWLVEPVIAIHDLDNIVLENLGDTRTLVAVFELEALVLTGHCSEKDHDPPRGLQFFLGTKSNPHLEDTLVMANLGYWQLKASPGVWSLSLAPGRSSELYTLEGTNKGTEEAPKTKRIILGSFGVKPVHLQVVKKKGKEKEKLLTETDDVDDEDDSQEEKKGWNSGLLKWASGLISSDEKNLNKHLKNSSVDKPGERKGETINIFSIASGHLYERFLKIMILSVLKNTDRPVKFWFIKNYLSPQFKDVIPHMAKEYGFDYELITYKWPTWLHKQTEKQRIIWAYKILFLDVIFPLNLKKVIFVDADQIIRTDMGELYDMNIKGKPLAYTPFCDNNKEMDGYRFWKQGFWKDHLRGRPYHISALYVVDLEKFRQMAAGDTLRVVYETLSKDPNSLSNLDQDLPNYAQHTVPIFSLPQEWLWCESWCGNATKSKSKTIDLCNNPMTKEPKLQGARRIVSEWPALDEEARSFTKRILGDEIEEPVTPDKRVTKDSSEIEDSESRAEL